MPNLPSNTGYWKFDVKNVFNTVTLATLVKMIDLKILERDNDGLLAFFGKTAVSEINTQLIREYFEVLDENRDEPLVATTKNKHGVVLNKVLKIASEDDVSSIAPE